MADLTYFVGRPYVRIEEDDQWAIVLDGDARITNYDPSLSAPDPETLQGTVFVRPIYSELDTRLQFGLRDVVQTEIILTPTQYAISEPNYTPEGEQFPQQPVSFEDELPEDPSSERVADGPEQPQEGEKASTKKKASKAS